MNAFSAPSRLTLVSAISAKRTSPEKPPSQTITLPQPPDKRKKLTSNHKSRRPPPSPAVALCNALDAMIDKFIDPPGLRPHVDPHCVLSGNFSPVTELPPTACPVIRGNIPPCLRGGAYIRNGPNPQHLPSGPHHLFDGDGMLHSLLLSPADSTAPATLSSRFVRTYKYELERQAGCPIIPNVFSAFHGISGVVRSLVVVIRILTGQMNPAEGIGLANTSLVFYNGQLYALGESDLPYAVHLSVTDGDISTVGRCDFAGKLSMGMTAHPKKDSNTGEMFAFRYGLVPPYVTYFRFDGAGNKTPDIPVLSIKQSTFLHDFAITENYAVFAENQIVMNLLNMVNGRGSPVLADHRKVPRIGIMPRHATKNSEMQWLEVPGLNIIHTINAWEEDSGEVVVLVAPNALSIEHAIEKMELVHSVVEMVRINRRTMTVTRRPMSEMNLEFGVINQRYVGIKNRYAYLGVGDPNPKISGVVKLDFERVGDGDCVVARREFRPGCFGGEPMFVPADEEGEEDEGYLVSYVHDERSGESRFVVMDAQSPELEVVAEVLLPRRVPYGFHGLFVTQAELRSQKSSGLAA